MYARNVTHYIYVSVSIAVAYRARAREPVDAYPTVHVPSVARDTPSAWLGHRTHIRDARTEIYAIGCEACTVAFIGDWPFYTCRFERTRAARHHLSIDRSTTANQIGDPSRLLITIVCSINSDLLWKSIFCKEYYNYDIKTLHIN